MKSSSQHITTSRIPNIESLNTLIKKEKEALVSMFLASASISELAEQYKRIDELHIKITLCSSV